MRVLEILSILRIWQSQHDNTCIYSGINIEFHSTLSLLFRCGKTWMMSILRTNTRFNDAVIAYQCVKQQVKISPRINRKLLLPWRIASKWYMKFLPVFLLGNGLCATLIDVIWQYERRHGTSDIYFLLDMLKLNELDKILLAGRLSHFGELSKKLVPDWPLFCLVYFLWLYVWGVKGSP